MKTFRKFYPVQYILKNRGHQQKKNALEMQEKCRARFILI